MTDIEIVCALALVLIVGLWIRWLASFEQWSDDAPACRFDRDNDEADFVE